MQRSVFAAAFLAAASLAPIVGAQDLGLWQARVGEGISYGAPGLAPGTSALTATDPVAALPATVLPIAPRPPAQAAVQAANRRPAPSPAVAKPTEHQVAASDPAVPIDLMQRPYDPDVPLPHPSLQGYQAPAPRLTKPQPFVRGEDHGGVVGLRVPFGTDRVPITTKDTRSSGRFGSPDAGIGGR